MSLKSVCWKSELSGKGLKMREIEKLKKRLAQLNEPRKFNRVQRIHWAQAVKIMEEIRAGRRLVDVASDWNRSADALSAHLKKLGFDVRAEKKKAADAKRKKAESDKAQKQFTRFLSRI